MEDRIKTIKERVKIAKEPNLFDGDLSYYSLIDDIEYLLSRIKELEEQRDGFRNGQLQLQDMVSTLMDSNAKWAKQVKELEEGVEKIYNYSSPGDTPEIDEVVKSLLRIA